MENRKSVFGLGIDAGGTYTDAVLYNFTEGKVVIASKAETTPNDYAVGIYHALSKLLRSSRGKLIHHIKLVSLSTTLATNAIVENKGGRVGLLLIGYDAYTHMKLPFEPKIIIEGKHSITGEILEPISNLEISRAVETLENESIDVFAVVDQVGMRNPEYEIKVCEYIRAHSKIPVVGAYELSEEINSVKRATSCYFNARLVPLVVGLLDSLHAVFAQLEIDVPLMVVKGDGSLMAERMARRYPIETILSGPAASAYGGSYLSGEKNTIVIDIGGTTTDIASIKGGIPQLLQRGITFENFRMAVKTIDIHTFGLGGDSYIKYNRKLRKITIGPRRVLPIARLSSEYPDVIKLLRKKEQIDRADEILVQPADFFIYQKDLIPPNPHPQELAIFSLLKKEGPLHITDIARKIDAVSCTTLRTDRLEAYGAIIRAGLTPTDLLHAEGKLKIWDQLSAKEAVKLYAYRAEMEVQQFIKFSWDTFNHLLFSHFFKNLLEHDVKISDHGVFAESLASLTITPNERLRIKVDSTEPIVMIGAPAGTYKKMVSDRIGGTVKVPPYYEVAGAVGAIIGLVAETTVVVIRPAQEWGFTAFTPLKRFRFTSLKKAKEEMVEWVQEYTKKKAHEAGANNPQIQVVVTDHEVEFVGQDKLYLETTITARATGLPLSIVKET